MATGDEAIKKQWENLKIRMHQPGIEPGSVPWQGTILPLDHWCVLKKYIPFVYIYISYIFFW